MKCSFDASSLFTCVPMHEAVEVIHEAVEVIHDMLRKDGILEERTSLLYQCMKQLR